MSLSLVPLGRNTTVTPGIDPRVDTATNQLRATDTSNKAVGLPGRLLSSLGQIIRSPVGAVQWGRTLDNKISRGAAAIHEKIGDWAHQAGRGPHAVAENIKSSFGKGSDRVMNLTAMQSALKIQKEERQKPEEEEPREISKRIDLSELRKQCAQFMRYTLRKQRADMQCEAFQRLVELTTLFPGLRLMLLLSEPILSHKPANLKDALSMSWDRLDSSLCPEDESEWRFWRSFAEMCLSEAPILLTIERCPITQFAQCQGTSTCVIEELLRAHRNCDDAKEVSSALCIRYLGQTVTLVEFWDQVKAADPAREDSPTLRPHTIVQGLCVLMRKTLQDLQPQDTRPLPFDYEGVDFLASKILDQVIEILQVTGAAEEFVGCWRTICLMVVRLLRQEWCKAYLPHSSRLAHSGIFNDCIPPKPRTDVSFTTKMQGLDENQRLNDEDDAIASSRNTEHAEETDLAASPVDSAAQTTETGDGTERAKSHPSPRADHVAENGPREDSLKGGDTAKSGPDTPGTAQYKPGSDRDIDPNLKSTMDKHFTEEMATETAPFRTKDHIDPANPSNHIVIGVMGPAGSGKSSFIRLLTGNDSIVGHGLESETSEITPYIHFSKDGRTVTFLDCPGFDDSREGATDTDVLRKIASFLEQEFKQDKKLSGIIYLHRITDPRMTGVSNRSLRMFRKLCGDDALKNVVVVTTRWEEISETHGAAMEERERLLMEKFFERIIHAGGRFVRHDNTIASARRIMEAVMQNDPIALQIQREMQDERTILEPAAGSALTADIQELVEKHRIEMKNLKPEMAAAAITAKDKVLKAERAI